MLKLWVNLMKPYREMFPDAQDPVTTLDVAKKSGGVPRGSYSFLECYCAQPGCDCRQVVVVVANEKMKPKAVIRFGFDGEGSCAGPYLDPACYQAPYAPDLIEFFVYALNSHPKWLLLMYRQYREVRGLVDGKRYRGKAFPEPGRLMYRAGPPPDLEAVLEESLLHGSRCSGAAAGVAKAGRCRSSRTPCAAGKRAAAGNAAPAVNGMVRLVDLYAKAGAGAPVGVRLALQEELRKYLAANPGAGDELAALLPKLCRQSPQDDESIEAALCLLCEALDFFLVELEGRGFGAVPQMARFQEAVARHVFQQNGDADLALSVAEILAGSRVRLIPELQLGVGKLLSADGRSDLREEAAQDLLSAIAGTFDSLGLTSPFEAAGELSQLFAANEPGLQIPLIAEMLSSDRPLLRDAAALMLFDADPEVSREVSQLLAGSQGSLFTPETLRRLIISRNWLPEPVRRNVDQAVSNARRAGVPCAPLAKSPAMTVYASPPDGAGAEGFQVVVPDGAAYCICGVLLQGGIGAVDCAVTQLDSKRELGRLVARLQKAGYAESSPEYLDLRVCHALGESVANGDTPGYRLVRVAEMLGRDRWKAIPPAGG